MIALFYFKKLCIFDWRIIALQYWFDFCHTSTWIRHRCTCIISLLTFLPPPTLFYSSRLLEGPRLSYLSHNSKFPTISNFKYAPSNIWDVLILKAICIIWNSNLIRHPLCVYTYIIYLHVYIYVYTCNICVCVYIYMPHLYAFICR